MLNVDFEQILNFLNIVVKENTFIVIVGMGILTSFLYDLIKVISFSVYKQTKKQVSKTALKGIKDLNESYKYEKTQIERIVNKDVNVIFEIVEDLYDSVFWLVLILTVYLGLKTFNAGAVAMGAFVGVSVSYFFKSFRILFFNLRLFEKARNSQRSIESLNKRILILEDIINKQSPELIR